MVDFDAYSSTKGVSPGVIWQDSALSAARMVEKYMSQEDQLVRLSDLHATQHTEYDRSSGFSQLQVEETVVGSSLGDFSEYGRSGSLTGTSFLWRASGGVLHLWDALDRTNVRRCEFVASAHAIVTVDLVHADSSTLFLIVATIWDVSLFYFDPVQTALVFSGYLTPTGGVQITCISTCGSRIFLGAADGSLFELVYDMRLATKASRRCYLSIISRPITALLPQWLGGALCWIGGAPHAVCSMATDATRSLLFAATNSDLRVFDIKTVPCETVHVTEYALKQAMSYTSYNVAAGAIKIVSVLSVGEGDVTCVLVSESGWRFYVAGQKVLSAKHPPRHPQLTVRSAATPDGGKTVLLECIGGLGVISFDEAWLAGAQQKQMRQAEPFTGPIRERWDWLDQNVICTSTLIADGKYWQALLLAPELVHVVGPSPGRKIAWENTDQESAELVSKLTLFQTTGTLERLMDSRLSQVELEPPVSTGILGGVARTNTVSVSVRTRGIALLLARELRQVWFKKAFHISSESAEKRILRPALSLAERDVFQLHVLTPLVSLFASYKPLFSQQDGRIIEGFSVLLSALQECMELFRIIDTGQLNRPEDKRVQTLEGVDRLLVRDIVLSAGVGDPALNELLASVNIRLATKACPLLVKHSH